MKATSFSFPAFVVWKTDAKGNKKGHAMIDIAKLNELVFFDSYLFSCNQR